MKKRILFIITILTGALFLQASDAYDIAYSRNSKGARQLTFSISDYKISAVRKAGISYSVLSFNNALRTQKKGWAELPFLSRTLLLSNDKNVSLHIISSQYQDVKLDAPMLPSRGTIYRNQNPESIPYTIDPKSIVDAWYPQQLAVADRPFIFRDFRGASIKVFPFQYNAVKQTLRIYTEVVVEVVDNNTTPVVNALKRKDRTISREMLPVYESVFVNFQEVRDDLTVGQYGDILVLTTDAYSDAIAPYVQWKKEKGFNVETEIVVKGINVDDLVQQKYDANNNLLYVQLVGDWNDIKSNTLDGAPMDPTLGWVAGDDNYQDIAVGRFSANSPADVTIQVNKTIQYERNPDVGASWYKAALGIGSDQGSDEGDDGEMDKVHIQNIYDNKLDPFTYDTYYTSYDPGSNTGQVSSALEDGLGIINYCGHGNEYSWGTSEFSNSNIANLSNGNKLPFIFSVACANGAFHSGECFGEAWLKKENGGAIIALMSSINQPWAPPMRGEDYFNDILTGGYDYDNYPSQNGINTSEQRTTIGSIIVNGLVLMYTESGESSDLETIETWTTFGDASLEVRTDTPKDITLSNNEIMQGVDFNTTVSVGGSPFEGAMVCISQGDNFFSGITDENGNVSISHSLIPGEGLLVVTAFNGNTIYQNLIVVPQNGPYVSMTDFAFDDAAGNNNGNIDFGEDVLIDVTLKNFGIDAAENLSITLSSEDDAVSITDAAEDCPNLSSEEAITLTGAFAFTVADFIEEGHSVQFDLAISNGTDTWEYSFNVILHAPEFTFYSFSVNDSNGNNNGIMDPGETVNMYLTIKNSGSADISNVNVSLSSDCGFVTVYTASANFGSIAAGTSATQSFEVSVDADTPPGTFVNFTTDITADFGYTGNGAFSAVIGQISVLVIDLDGNTNSGSFIKTAIENNDVAVEYTTSIPTNVNLYASIFLCLGVYPNAHTLTVAEGQIFADYLNNGGKLYMEGGDAWASDPQTPVHTFFNIYGEDDGSGGLFLIEGQSGTFTEEMSFSYTGDDTMIDHISPAGSAFLLFKKYPAAYGLAVAYDAGIYKTIGSSCEFGGFVDGDFPSTKDELIKQYLEFFGIGGGASSLIGQFAADQTTICKMHSVNFTDQSLGGATSWLWTFEGGEPASSTEQNPSVYYENPGNYDVELIVSNGSESDTITKSDYITVNPCIGIAEDAGETFYIYPNPCHRQVFVKASQEADLEIRDILGNQKLQLEGVFGDFKLDVTDYDPGLYFLILKTENETFIQKLIVQ